MTKRLSFVWAILGFFFVIGCASAQSLSGGDPGPTSQAEPDFDWSPLAVNPPGTTVLICDPATAQCASAFSVFDFSIVPSRTAFAGTSGGAACKVPNVSSTLSLIALCVVVDNNGNVTKTVPNCSVSLTATPVPNTGGHDHDDPSRPGGQLLPRSGNTGLGGLQFQYTAPTIGGQITIGAAGIDDTGKPLQPSSAKVRIEVPGLVSMPSAFLYGLIGQTSSHSINHFLDPNFEVALNNLAFAWYSGTPSGTPKLQFNDMSLLDGGVFDLNLNWSPPHCGHWNGTNVDVRLVPWSLRPFLAQLLKLNGIGLGVKHKDHWHLKFPP